MAERLKDKIGIAYWCGQWTWTRMRNRGNGRICLRLKDLVALALTIFSSQSPALSISYAPAKRLAHTYVTAHADADIRNAVSAAPISRSSPL
jgi:hypothetical protein